MRVGLTGATGRVGHFLHRGLRRAGHEVVTIGRKGADRPFALGGPAPDMAGLDGLVHAAFSHVPGRYRGGEGDDPAGFVAANVDGTLRLLEAAGERRIIFLSSRAVYGAYPPGTRLTEDLAPRPDTLYGEVKKRAEKALDGRNAVNLRATGVYGVPAPGQAHKWQELFADFSAGRPITPRVATEVHGDDLAAACALCLALDVRGPLNVSDILLDRHDLLSLYADAAGLDVEPPRRADPSTVSAMDCGRLSRLGWRPGGWAALERTVETLARGA